jgi:CBS domain-containing protein
MTTDVVTFAPGDNVRDAMRRMLVRDVDAAPVVDEGRRVVGVVSTADLIVQESTLHLPAVISILGATFTLPWEQDRFEEDLEKALGARVEEVMAHDPVTVAPHASLERAATLMHEHRVSRLPVVDDEGVLVGILARGDIVRAIVADQDGPGPDEG